ncbi:MAG TPA: S24/S26 family peptidase [Planctomycetota bacterium]|nr:S24/S26 family peptidase [Planctomycetota bacterium]
MSWAEHAKEALRRGETVRVRPRGHSMQPKVHDGDLVTLAPCSAKDLAVGAIVLVRVADHDFLHQITAIDGERYQIGNSRGGINGWVDRAAIYGCAIRIERA